MGIETFSGRPTGENRFFPSPMDAVNKTIHPIRQAWIAKLVWCVLKINTSDPDVRELGWNLLENTQFNQEALDAFFASRHIEMHATYLLIEQVGPPSIDAILKINGDIEERASKIIDDLI